MTLYSTPYGTSTPVENYFENNEISIINYTFTQSSSYTNIPIAGTNTDVRLLRSDKDPDNQHMKRLMFRPMTQVLEGSVAVIKNNNWLVTEFSNHPYFPTAQILECNEYMRWNTKDNVFKQYPCVVSQDPRQVMLHSDKEMLMSAYETQLFVTYNSDTSTIKEGLRLILSGRAYWIVGVDKVSHVYNGNGYILFSIQSTTFNSNDDILNEVADNSAYYYPQSNNKQWGVNLNG